MHWLARERASRRAADGAVAPSKSRKRALDRVQHNQLQQEARNAARRIHEMYLIIKRLSPRETTRDYPCSACTR